MQTETPLTVEKARLQMPLLLSQLRLYWGLSVKVSRKNMSNFLKVLKRARSSLIHSKASHRLPRQLTTIKEKFVSIVVSADVFCPLK